MKHLSQNDFQNWSDYYREYQLRLAKDYYIPLLEEWDFSVTRKKILDIGCGDGGFTSAFTDSANSCSGIEIKSFDWSKISNVNFLVQDITKSNAVENIGNEFDLIILRDVIEHIPLENKQMFLDSLSKFEHSETKILITYPPFYSPFGLHQQTFLKSKLSKIPFLSWAPSILLQPLLRLVKENETAIENIKYIRDCRMTISNFEKLIKQSNFVIEQNKFYFTRPSHEIRYGWKTRISPFGSIPLLREILVLGTVYLLSAEK